MWELPAEHIVAKGKLGPGEMIAVDLDDGVLLDTDAIDRINRGARRTSSGSSRA